MAKITVAALESTKTVESDVAFNQTTMGLDLRIQNFDVEGFEQIANGYRFVFLDGRILLGKEEALASTETPRITAGQMGCGKVSERQQIISAFSNLIRYGAVEGTVIGYQPKYNAGQFGTVGFVRSNYQGVDIPGIPEDGNWYEVGFTPMPGTANGGKTYIGNKLDHFAQIRKTTVDLVEAGYMIDFGYAKGQTEKGENLLDWLRVVLGHNQAVIDGDAELEAIYKTRYNEGRVSGQLNRAAAKALSGKTAEERQATVKESVVMATIHGEELDLSTLEDGTLIRFQNNRGVHQGQQTWFAENPYAVQRFRVAAERGLAAEIMFDPRAI